MFSFHRSIIKLDEIKR